MLKLLISENDDLEKRYKSISGNNAVRIDNILNDLLYVHVDLSASNCMTRIANIMNKFNMEEDFVLIELK